jgi:hypothetical protein
MLMLVDLGQEPGNDLARRGLDHEPRVPQLMGM